MDEDTAAASESVRARLLEGFGEAVGRTGYAAATIADIVRHAGVSKRTFYEHFADKDECFLAAYDDASRQVLEALESAVDPGAPWEAQVRAAVEAYLLALGTRPALARTFMLEIQAAGPRAIKARRRVHQQFAERIRGLVTQARRRNPSVPPLTPAMATALVGGINELMLLRLEAGAHAFTDLTAAALAFAGAVLTARPR